MTGKDGPGRSLSHNGVIYATDWGVTIGCRTRNCDSPPVANSGFNLNSGFKFRVAALPLAPCGVRLPVSSWVLPPRRRAAARPWRRPGRRRVGRRPGSLSLEAWGLGPADSDVKLEMLSRSEDHDEFNLASSSSIFNLKLRPSHSSQGHWQTVTVTVWSLAIVTAWAEPIWNLGTLWYHSLNYDIIVCIYDIAVLQSMIY